MKKTLITVLAFAFLLSFATHSFALMRKDIDVMKGSIVSIDSSKNEVVVKNAAGEQMAFNVTKGVDPSLSNGNDVIVIFKKGTNVAKSVRRTNPSRYK